MTEYVEFLSEKEQSEKDSMLSRLENTKQQLWKKIEQTNEIFAELQELSRSVNEEIASINKWIRKIHSSKSKEIEQLEESEDKRTKMNDLHCYSDLKKFRFSVPSMIDEESVVDDINAILVEFDEMP